MQNYHRIEVVYETFCSAEIRATTRKDSRTDGLKPDHFLPGDEQHFTLESTALSWIKCEPRTSSSMALPGFRRCDSTSLTSRSIDPLVVHSAERGGRANGHVLRFITTVSVKYRIRTLRHGWRKRSRTVGAATVNQRALARPICLLLSPFFLTSAPHALFYSARNSARITPRFALKWCMEKRREEREAELCQEICLRVFSCVQFL